MKLLNFFLLLNLFILLSFANEITQISFEEDKEGNLNPSIFLPIIWNNKNYYSGIGYTSSTLSIRKKIDNFKDSKNSFISTKNKVIINWITKKINNYSIGIQTSIEKIHNNEFGYIHDTKDIFKQGNDYWIAFDNDIKLDILETSIYMDYTTKFTDLFLKTTINIIPIRKIDVKQSTLFKPLISKSALSNSHLSQNLAYFIKLDLYYYVNNFFNLGFDYSYNYNPLKYHIDKLSYENDSYVFRNSLINIKEITTKYISKIYFNKKILNELKPFIGFGKIIIKNIDKNSHTIFKENRNILTFGFEQRF